MEKQPTTGVLSDETKTSDFVKPRLCAASRKQSIIQSAYEREGFEWKIIEGFVSSDGWTKRVVGFPKRLTTGSGVSYRPALPDGFTDNNGWTPKDIEFPDDSETVFWINIENYEHDTASLMHDDFDHNDYTHWHRLPPKAPVW